MKTILWNILLLCLLVSCEKSNLIIPNDVSEKTSNQKTAIEENHLLPKKSQLLLWSDLTTDTSKKSIDLSDILDGWPGKDWIPAIDNPLFINIKDASTELNYLTDESQWIAVSVNWKNRFYPYEILVWHEIVNDTISWKNIAVTFCPLCGSAIVYDRDINWETLEFWVSGKLYESNMLMYDRNTESLWSQSLGQSVVWEYLGTDLTLFDWELLTFSEFTRNFPTWQVLSDDTGYSRQYWYIPYVWYEDSDHLFFPVKWEDVRYPKKEMFYIINDSSESIAFRLSSLRAQKKANLNVGESMYSLEFDDWIITATKNSTEKLPGYYEMWFSWVTHNLENKNVWDGE